MAFTSFPRSSLADETALNFLVGDLIVEQNAAVRMRHSTGWLFLAIGLLLGLGIAALWPQRPLNAASSDRNDKFGMCTVIMTDGLEAVFVLDFLTGRLTGACLGRQGNGFVQFFAADVAADLGVAAGKPQYAMTPGLATIRATPGAQPAASVIYVAELNSGIVGCYAIPFKLPNNKNPVPQRLAPLDKYHFRDAIVPE